jgi:CheY-like chemotaxis protein
MPVAAKWSFHGVTILVVEDHFDSRELLVALLEGHGATVLAADTARRAFELLKAHHPDLVVSDVGLPDEDGHDLIRRIRRLGEAEGGATPAIALTAYATSDDRRAALAAGFDDYITKPLEINRLLDAVHELVRGPSSALQLNR